MTDTDKHDDQKATRVASAMVYVPGRGLVILDQDNIVAGMARAGLEESKTLPCFLVRGVDRGTEWIHVYSTVVGEDVEEALRESQLVPAPLSFRIMGGGALVINHEDDGFVRVYGPGTWDRIWRVSEEFIGQEEEDSPDAE